jgi:hypothetical protein
VGGDVRIDVLVYTAVSMVCEGRRREGIAALETLLYERGGQSASILTTEASRTQSIGLATCGSGAGR